MNEEELLDDIFGDNKKWKGKFRLWWCDLCDTFSIGCPKKCGGSSCNACGCPECIEEHKNFNKNAKTNPKDYLNEEEQKTYDKINWLKKYMKESLLENEYEINWKRMKQQGNLCKHTQELFKKEIKESFKKHENEKYGDY